LAVELLKGKIEPNSTVRVDVLDGEMVFDIVPAAETADVS
jgi:hypothetical protein